MIHMHIGLKQSQFNELERHLYEGVTRILPKTTPYNFGFWKAMKLTNAGSL